MPSILDSILRAGEGKILRQLKRISEQINSVEDDFVAMSDAELRGMTDEFKQRLAETARRLTTSCPRRSPRSARRRAARSASAPSTCS